MAMTAADKQRMKEIKERYPFDMKAFVKSAMKSRHGICIAVKKESNLIAATDGYKGFLCNDIQQTVSDMAFLQGNNTFNRNKLDFNKFMKFITDATKTLYHSDMELVKKSISNNGEHLGFFYSQEEKLLVPIYMDYAEMLQDYVFVEGNDSLSPIVASYPNDIKFVILPVKWMRSGEKYKAVCAYHGIEVD